MFGNASTSTNTLLPPATPSFRSPTRNHKTMMPSSFSSLKVFAASATATTTSVDSVKKNSSADTLYQLLRISETASQAEIKAAYRNLAKVYHPDAVSSDSNVHDFIEIHNAYTTLSDPAARARYDMSIAARRQLSYSISMPTTSGSGGFRTSRRWETDQCW